MGNKLPPNVTRGTLGELLAQVYLLAHGVQAAPPIRDSGNDLIACRKGQFRALQVKTRKTHNFSRQRFPEFYDGVVLVVLKEDNEKFGETPPIIYLMLRNEFEEAKSLGKKGLAAYRICPERIKLLFPPLEAGQPLHDLHEITPT